MKHLVSVIEIFILLTTLSFLCSCSTAIPICERGLQNCCADYKWNTETDRCEKCLPGYTGVNCSQSCPYPFYGDRCQKQCDCDNDTCDVSVGCGLTTADGETISLVSNATVSRLIENSTISKTENYSTDIPVRGRKPSSVNDILLILVETFGCVDLLLICAHFFYLHPRTTKYD